MRPTVALAVDATASAGLGHLARGSAVATALRARGVTARCHALGASQEISFDDVAWAPCPDLPSVLAGSPAALVLDSYAFAADGAPVPATTPIVAFDDGGAVRERASLLVTTGSAPAGTRTLAGLAHVPLRRAFWGLPRMVVRERVERVLVSTGGGDVSDAAAVMARAATVALPDATVALVRGPLARSVPPDGVELVEGATSLLAELERADLVVSAAGQTALEAAAVGVPAIAVALVANQRRNASALAQVGAAVVVDAAATDLAERIDALADDLAERRALSARAQAAVDGYGALRVAYAVERLIAESG